MTPVKHNYNSHRCFLSYLERKIFASNLRCIPVEGLDSFKLYQSIDNCVQLLTVVSLLLLTQLFRKEEKLREYL